MLLPMNNEETPDLNPKFVNIPQSKSTTHIFLNRKAKLNTSDMLINDHPKVQEAEVDFNKNSKKFNTHFREMKPMV